MKIIVNIEFNNIMEELKKIKEIGIIKIMIKMIIEIITKITIEIMIEIMTRGK